MEEFEPCLYNFELPREVESGLPLAPPLWAIVDHLIALVWQLQSNRASAGVVQLRWIQEFLNSLQFECTRYRNLDCLKIVIDKVILVRQRSTAPAFKIRSEQPSSKRFDSVTTSKSRSTAGSVASSSKSNRTASSNVGSRTSSKAGSKTGSIASGKSGSSTPQDDADEAKDDVEDTNGDDGGAEEDTGQAEEDVKESNEDEDREENVTSEKEAEEDEGGDGGDTTEAEGGDKNGEEEKVNLLLTSVVLKDILSRQPAKFKLKVGEGISRSSSKGQTDNCRDTNYSSCKVNNCKQDRSIKEDCSELLVKNKDLAKYLSDLKEQQNEILQREQKHLDILDSLIKQMN